MITLAIDTSTAHGSVAVLNAGSVVFGEQFTAGRGHGSRLSCCLERALGAEPHCDQIVIGLGPGSYSGIRVAIATAIGLEFGIKARLLGIPSIAALESGATHYQAIGDARRGTFYYAQVSDGECLEGPLLLDAAELREWIDRHASLPVFASSPIDGIPNLEIRYPGAERLARLAELGRGISARDDLEPIYLRDPHITQPRKL
jgi:tRNA threonylcarbamoyl adenosine modification protein YeaZ